MRWDRPLIVPLGKSVEMLDGRVIRVTRTSVPDLRFRRRLADLDRRGDHPERVPRLGTA